MGELNRIEPARLRVIDQQLSGETFAEPGDFLDDLGRLQRADDTGDGAENAHLRAIGDEARRRRFWEDAAQRRVGRPVRLRFVRLEDRDVTIKRAKRSVDQRLFCEETRIGDEIARGEVVRTVGDDVVARDEIERVVGGDARVMGFDIDVRIEPLNSVARTLDLRPAGVLRAMRDLTLQVVDRYRVVVDHAKPNGQSRERFRNILDGNSAGVFQGKIIVRPGAQKTDGVMQSKAVLLSDGATMNNKPELEIFADDVTCGHGSTSGALDESLLFYLRARGLPEKEAQALLIQAFVGEAIESIAGDTLRELAAAAAERWLRARS